MMLYGLGVSRTSAMQSDKVIKFVPLSALGRQPTKGSARAAGHDLYSSVSVEIPAKSRILVGTDIKICLPPHTYGRIAPRSGLALHHGIDVGAGIIDEDYRGPINVLLFNHSSEPFKVNAGDRIAQLICQPFHCVDFERVDSLDESERGEKGFGSSGV